VPSTSRPSDRRPAVKRPTAADLEAARDVLIPDVIAPDLRVLFCGINPGLWSGAVGKHFARPGNRFWPALHASGFTPELFTPDRQDELLALGLGISNVVDRTTARADELTTEEYREGARLLTAKAAHYRPAWIAIVGITAYRTAFARPAAKIGPQDEPIAESRVWALPNPSGLNAHWSAAALAEEFGRFRAVAEADR
jgi:double-stranded uracil-DNA glycosylase